jgi:hypothetical protein
MSIIESCIVIEALTLIGLIIVARIYWRLKSNQDPLLSIVPVKAVQLTKRLPRVLIKADQEKTRLEYIDNNG